MTYLSDKRLYLTADGQVTDDPEQAHELLVGEGGELRDEDAARYGLTGGKGSKAVSTAPENKAVAAPVDDAGTGATESKS